MKHIPIFGYSAQEDRQVDSDSGARGRADDLPGILDQIKQGLPSGFADFLQTVEIRDSPATQRSRWNIPREVPAATPGAISHSLQDLAQRCCRRLK